jgi:hypothetical protein
VLLPYLDDVHSLALIGIGKNVGKTTALNQLIREARAAHQKLGLTSIGRDGELFDAISSHPKPPIQVPVGSLVATVEGVLPAKRRAWQVLEKTGERTALGPVVIAEALQEVHWEITGPSTHLGLQRVKQRMLDLGADLVVIDGAFDRRSSATPALTDATILVSGAALDPDIDKVIAETTHLVRLLQTPPADLSPGARQLLQERHIAVDEQELPLTSALGASEAIRAALRPDSRRILVGTALTRSLLEAAGSREVTTRDATQILVEALDLKRFRGKLTVADPIRLPLLICNPYSPYGWRFDSREFRQRLSEAVHPLPVVDVLQDEGAP